MEFSVTKVLMTTIGNRHILQPNRYFNVIRRYLALMEGMISFGMPPEIIRIILLYANIIYPQSVEEVEMIDKYAKVDLKENKRGTLDLICVSSLDIEDQGNSLLTTLDRKSYGRIEPQWYALREHWLKMPVWREPFDQRYGPPLGYRVPERKYIDDIHYSYTLEECVENLLLNCLRYYYPDYIPSKKLLSSGIWNNYYAERYPDEYVKTISTNTHIFTLSILSRTHPNEVRSVYKELVPVMLSSNVFGKYNNIRCIRNRYGTSFNKIFEEEFLLCDVPEEEDEEELEKRFAENPNHTTYRRLHFIKKQQGSEWKPISESNIINVFLSDPNYFTIEQIISIFPVQYHQQIIKHRYLE